MTPQLLHAVRSLDAIIEGLFLCAVDYLHRQVSASKPEAHTINARFIFNDINVSCNTIEAKYADLDYHDRDEHVKILLHLAKELVAAQDKPLEQEAIEAHWLWVADELKAFFNVFYNVLNSEKTKATKVSVFGKESLLTGFKEDNRLKLRAGFKLTNLGGLVLQRIYSPILGGIGDVDEIDLGVIDASIDSLIRNLIKGQKSDKSLEDSVGKLSDRIDALNDYKEQLFEQNRIFSEAIRSMQSEISELKREVIALKEKDHAVGEELENLKQERAAFQELLAKEKQTWQKERADILGCFAELRLQFEDLALKQRVEPVPRLISQLSSAPNMLSQLVLFNHHQHRRLMGTQTSPTTATEHSTLRSGVSAVGDMLSNITTGWRATDSRTKKFK